MSSPFLSKSLFDALYCYDEDEVIQIMKKGEVDIDGFDSNDAYNPLLFASEHNLQDIVAYLLEQKADLQAFTRDISMLYGAVQSGGQTALHLSAAKGYAETVSLLLHAKANPMAEDFDHNTPYVLAAMHDRSECMKLLQANQPIPDKNFLQEKLINDGKVARKRYHASLNLPEAQQKVYTMKQVFSIDECKQVLSKVFLVAEEQGWTGDRHTSYVTTDMPLSRVPTAYSFVHAAVRERIFPYVAAQYKLAGPHVLGFRDLFVVKYSAAPDQQAELGLHKDGGELSFNILLNADTAFEGGGTYVQPLDTVFTIKQGDCFIHPGQMQHAGSLITSGERYILVGFLNLLHYVPSSHC